MIELIKTYEIGGGRAEVWQITDDEAVLAAHGSATVSLSLYRETSAAHAAEFAQALATAAMRAGVGFAEEASIDCTLVAIAPADLPVVLQALATVRCEQRGAARVES